MYHRQATFWRSLPHKVGLKLFARDFDLSGTCPAPFAPSDIADCVPVCKPAPLQSKDVRMLLDHGKIFLRANSLPHAFEYFRQAQERAVQTCGVLHADNAEAFAYLAKIAHKFGENAQAVQFLQSSLSIRYCCALPPCAVVPQHFPFCLSPARARCVPRNA
jgi:hypothetical protein